MRYWRIFPLLPILLPLPAFAAETDYDTSLKRLPEGIEQRQEAFQQPPSAPRTVDRSTISGPEAAANFSVSTDAIPQARTDPFQISYFMHQKAQAGNLGGLQFTPLQNVQVPTLIMRGIVSGGLALLDVEGHGVYLVREGDTLSLNRQGQNTVIKIEKIDRLSLMVKIGTLNEMIVVR